MSDLCIMIAPNGARRTKTDHVQLPISPFELAETAISCGLQGASAIHLHVRDRGGRHTLEPDAYRAAIEAISAASPMLIQITTEAAGMFELPVQMKAVRDLRPSFISFGFQELFREGLDAAKSFLNWCAGAGIAIQFILYDPSEVSAFAALWRAGQLYLSAPPRLLLVVGRYSKNGDSNVGDLEQLLGRLAMEDLLDQCVWMTCAFGRGELDCLECAIERGGHARVGFENAIIDNHGLPARDNAQRTAAVAEIAARLGRPLAGVDTARDILGVTAPFPILP